MLVDHPLHLGAGDVLATRDDEVLQAIDDEEVAVVVAHADVAGVEPTAGEGPGGGLLVAPVAREDLRPPEHDLAWLARGDRAALVVPDIQVEVEARPADAAELGDDAVAVEEGVPRHRLGQAVGVGEPGRRERALDPLDQRDRHLLAAVDDHPHRREVARLDLGQRHDRVHHRRGEPHGGDARALDLVDHGPRVEAPVDDHGGAGRDQRGGREVERAHVVQRPARQAEVVAGEAELHEVGEALPRQVGVRQHHALRAAGRPGRVHEP